MNAGCQRADPGNWIALELFFSPKVEPKEGDAGLGFNTFLVVAVSFNWDTT